MTSETQDLESTIKVFNHNNSRKKAADYNKNNNQLKEKDYQELARQLAKVNDDFSGNLGYKVHWLFSAKPRPKPTTTEPESILSAETLTPTIFPEFNEGPSV